MVQWVVGSILHGVDPLSYFSFQPVLHDWCNKGRDMCYPVCGMVQYLLETHVHQSICCRHDPGRDLQNSRKQLNVINVPLNGSNTWNIDVLCLRQTYLYVRQCMLYLLVVICCWWWCLCVLLCPPPPPPPQHHQIFLS